MLAIYSSNQPSAAIAAMRQACRRLTSRVRLLAGTGDTHITASWSALVAEVEAGFSQEESIMEAFGCGDPRPQRANNAHNLCALHRVTPQGEAGETAPVRMALAALADILSLAAPRGPADAGGLTIRKDRSSVARTNTGLFLHASGGAPGAARAFTPCA